MNPACSMDGCNKPSKSRTWCSGHYERWRKHGDPTTVLPPIPPPPNQRTQGEECSEEKCSRPPLARGYCSNHYRAWRLYGSAATNRRRPRLRCRIDTCERPAHGHGLCQLHYLRWYHHGDPTWQPPTFDTCVMDQCDKPTRSSAHPLCEMHYGRWYRNSDPTMVRRVTGRVVNSAGYVLVLRHGHDLAHASGWTYEHRLVLFETIGPGDHPCWWCDEPVSWDLTYPQDMHALVVDHLDGTKDNNEPSNLVPACNPCNMTRESLGNPVT